MTNLEKKLNPPCIKRRLASEEGILFDLEKELPMFFQAFEEACVLYNSEVVQTPPESRCRSFEASLFNSKLIQCIQKFFPFNWKYGKYKRFILSVNGYLFLCKKLDQKGKPMNIKTKMVDLINCQLMGSLFEETNYVEEPIIYFGYKKDRFGIILDPQLVYIDENQVKWSLGEKDLAREDAVAMEGTQELLHATPEIAVPKLRSGKKKKVANE